MAYIAILTICIITGIFSASNYLENEIEVRNKMFKEIKINKGWMNLLYFKKRYSILNFCLIERILGYIVSVLLVIILIIIYLFDLDNNYYYLSKFFMITFWIGVFNALFIFIIVIIGKLQQKYSFGDLKNDKKSLDIKEYSWEKYMPFAGDVCMFKEQGFKYLRAEEWYKDGEFGYGKTEMYFSTNPPNELKRYLQNLDIICK